MIPLSKILEIGKRRRAAVACDAADDEICTAEDPAKCRVHGIRRYEREGDYLDKLAHASEEQKKAEAVVNYFQNLANSMTKEEVDSEISSVFHVSITSMEDFEKTKERMSLAQRTLAESIIGKHESVDESCVAKTKRSIGATLKHLKQKYTSFALPKDCALIIMRNKDKGKLGTTASYHDGESPNICMAFACVGGVRNDDTFSHGDYRDDFDYIMHELWHMVEYAMQYDDERFYRIMCDRIGKEKTDSELQKVSRYAVRMCNKGEAEAECFAMISSNDYEDALCKEIVGQIMSDMKGK